MIMNASFLLRLSILVTSVSGFVPSVPGNARTLGEIITSPQHFERITATATTSQRRTKSVSLSAVLEAGMDPMFTTMILAAAVMASVALNPDKEDTTMSTFAKSLMPPPVEEEVKEVKAISEVKTNISAPAEKVAAKVQEAPKKTVVAAPPKPVAAVPPKPVAAVTPKPVAAVTPTAVAATKKTVSKTAKNVTPKEVILAMATEVDEFVKEHALSVEEKKSYKSDITGVSPGGEGEAAAVAISTTPDFSIAAEKEKIEKIEKLMKYSIPAAVTPTNFDEIDTKNGSSKKSSFAKKVVKKSLMPWRKFSDV